MDFGNKYRNKHNTNQSQTIHITKAEIDMNITHESVHQSSGQIRSTIIQKDSYKLHKRISIHHRVYNSNVKQQKLLN